MRIGIDLGGTKIAAVALLGDSVIWQQRIASPSNSYDALIDAIAGLVAEAERACGRRGTVGIGIPGSIDAATGLVKNANTTALIHHPAERDLAAALGRPVRVANDANCFIASEAADGAAASAKIAFGVILGTGVGGGVAVEGQLLEGVNRITGEWGHNPLPWPRDDERPGPPCYCGRYGCIETFLSGPALGREHAAEHGGSLTAAEIAALPVDHAHRRARFERYYDRLARALATIINVLDPEVIVLGGGLSQIVELYTEVPKRWGRYVFSPSVLTRLERARHGDASGVRGAARLWPMDAAPPLR